MTERQERLLAAIGEAQVHEAAYAEAARVALAGEPSKVVKYDAPVYLRAVQAVRRLRAACERELVAAGT